MMTEKEKSKKEIGEMATIMAASIPRLDTIIKDYFKRLYDSSEKYQYLGKDFSFKANSGYYDDTIDLLTKMSNSVYGEIRDSLMAALRKLEDSQEEDYEIGVRTLEEKEKDGLLLLPRLDNYTLKFSEVAEAFIAGAIVSNTSFADMYVQYKVFQNAPWLADVAKKIGIGKQTVGSGNYISTLANYIREMKFSVASGVEAGKHSVMERKGFQWYRCFRNSNYDCPICDDVCAVPHRITEVVLPVHPNCVCGMYPINDPNEM